MQNNRVLVSGASIAGPALAYWLGRSGFEVTVVEKSPSLRGGGQAVDFKGATHMSVLSRVGILDEVRAASVHGEDGRVVDARGRTLAVVPQAFTGGELEIPRGDLAEILYRRSADTAEYLFDDSIASITETDGGVDVTFTRSAPRTFDLVIGADGIHSNVRRLVFGPESEFVRHLGYHYALADIPIEGGGEMYTEPGRTAAIGGAKAPAFFVFASDPIPFDRSDVAAQKQVLTDAYRGAGWRVPEMLAALPEAGDFYLDSIARATVDHYSRGRVALLGDAAFGNTLGGFGTGLALVGAYVLAGELGRAGGDHRLAFPRFEAAFRRYAKVAEQVNAGRLLAPRTRLGIRARNAMFAMSPLLALLMRFTERSATNIALEDYESAPVA